MSLKLELAISLKLELAMSRKLELAMSSIIYQYLQSNYRPINSRESSPADDNDLSRGSGLSGLSALSAAYTPKEKKNKLEMTERRRSKLRDIEVTC